MTEEEKVGNFALVCSFVIPIIGIIYYFVNRKKIEDALFYPWVAVIGFVFGGWFRLLGL